MNTRTSKMPAVRRPWPAAWTDWSNRRLLRFMIGQHTPDVDQDPDLVRLLGNGRQAVARQRIWKKLDPAKLVHLTKTLGAEVLYFYAKCGFGNAYYPSRVGHVHSLMKDRDYMAEIIAECRRCDIVPVALYEVTDTRIRKEKPEWCFRWGGAGKGAMGGECLLGPYGEFMLKQIEEILGSYDLAGIYVDMCDAHAWSHAVCPHCHRRYRAETGRDLPNWKTLTPAGKLRYYAWHREQMADLMRRIREICDRLAPHCLFEHNFHGRGQPMFGHSWKENTRLADGFTSDIFAFLDGSAVDIYIPKAYRTARSRQRSWILEDAPFACSTTGFDISTPKPLDVYLTQAASILANDLALCTSISVQFDGTMDLTQANLIRHVNRHFKSRMPFLLNAEPLAAVALVWPSMTMDLLGDEGRNRIYLDEFTGWSRLLTESHVLYDVLVDELLPRALPSKYQVLILPHAELLPDEQVASLRRFAEKGGLLIATGHAAWCNGRGARRTDFGLADLLGVSLVKPLTASATYLHVRHPALVDPDPTISPWIFMPEGHTQVKAKRGTENLAMVAAKPSQEVVSYLRHETAFPALTRTSAGACYFAGLPGLTYARRSYPALLNLVQRLLEPALKRCQAVRVSAPRCIQVEASLQPAQRRLVVHLINRGGGSGLTTAVGLGKTTGFTPDYVHKALPVRDVMIALNERVTGRVRRAYSAPDGTPLKIVRRGPSARVTTDIHGAHAMIAFDLKGTVNHANG